MQRRLAAILIADVVGYSRLSQIDDEGTRMRFQADQRDVFEPAIAAHSGRLVKTMGDALLVEFGSVVDAVRCAVEIQRAKAEGSSGLGSDKRLDFRIGINIGDVIVEGDDIHGDGVNVAARLQSLAEPGGIIMSGPAYDQVQGKLDIDLEFSGEQRIKNIAAPVRTYRVSSSIGKQPTRKFVGQRRKLGRSGYLAGIMVIVMIAGGALLWRQPWRNELEQASPAQMALPLPDRPSIVVLPFANMSDDPKQEYFADGMTDDLITGLSRVSGLFVISRNSSFVYKGKAVQPKQVSEELGVRYVLEGSVQRSNDRLRINAQLIDALSGGHVWAERIDGSLEDVFSLEDNVTRTVADALAQKLGAPATQPTNPAETHVPAAYDELLRGMEHFRRTTPEDYAAAIPRFEHAIKLDPNYGRAYAALALLYLRIRDRDYGPALGITPADAWTKAKGYLAEAQRHPTAGSHQVTGYILLDSTSPEDAVAEFQQAVALDPSDSWNHVFLGTALANGGSATRGESQIRTAMRLDPHYPPIFEYYLALTQFIQEHFDQAASSLNTVLQSNPDDQFSLLLLTAAYGHLGKMQEAKQSFERHNKVVVSRGYIPTVVQSAGSMFYQAVDDHDRVVKGLRLAGVPEYLLAGEFASRNHLNAEEIRKLAFGHRLHGRDWGGWTAGSRHARNWTTGAEYDAVVSPSGTITMTGPWGSVWNAATAFDGDKLCYITPTGGEICGDMFRNPGGTRVLMNEMIWNIRGQIFTFSAID